MRILAIIGHAFATVSKLGAFYVRCLFTKRTAVKTFEQELRRLGLPPDVREHLTADYAAILNLNPLAYASAWKKGTSR